MTATLSNWRQHPFSSWGFCNVDKLIAVEPIAGAKAEPLPPGPALDLAAISIDGDDRRLTVAAALTATQTDGFLVLHDGKVVAETYGGVQDVAARHIVFSVSKSITGVLAGSLVADGILDPERLVTQYAPEARGSAYDGATVRNLLDMTVNIRFVEDYVDPLGDVARYRVAMGWNPPGAVTSSDDLHGFITKLSPGDGRHGARFHYVSPNSDMLGWVIERAAGQRLHRLLSERLWQPMGASDDGFITVDRNGSPRSAGGIWVITAKKGTPTAPCRAANGAGYLKQDSLIPLGKAAGLVDNKICSLSDCESAMRFVIPKDQRAK